MGSVRVAGKTFSKAAAAGRDPDALWRLYAEILHASLKTRLWRGATTWRRIGHRRCRGAVGRT